MNVGIAAPPTPESAPRRDWNGAARDVRVRPWFLYVNRLKHSRLRADFHERVSEAVPPETGGKWLVDVGCGPGLLEAMLAQRLPRTTFVGVDIDRRMLTMAHAEQGLATVVASSAFLPFRSGCIDLVVSTASLKDWRDWRGGLFEIARILVPGGNALVYDFLTTGEGARPRRFVRRYGIVSELLRRLMGRFAPFSREDVLRLVDALRASVDVTVHEELDLGAMGIQFRKPEPSPSGIRTEEKPRVTPK